VTEVRIRHEWSPDSAILGDVPFMETEKIIDHLKRWGVRDEDGSVDTDLLCGEFVVTDRTAYFEVMIGLDE
jgi:hypothetical protein